MKETYEIICITMALAMGLMLLERCIPDRKLADVKGWWPRAFFLNLVSLTVTVQLAGFWKEWSGVSLLGLDWLPALPAGLFSYFLLTFINYWWHRVRHDSEVLWKVFHQVHHSPQRMETITTFYKHPLEGICNVFIFGVINNLVLGLSVEGSFWAALLAGVVEMYYHLNIRTPRWTGIFIQRPEMHRIHHERGRHYDNFSDLPLWDWLFGTYKNPEVYEGPCGFGAERERRLVLMLRFQNVNGLYRITPLWRQKIYRKILVSSSAVAVFFLPYI